jgi:hypothetical protein
MNSINRSLLAIAMAGALGGATSLTRAGILSGTSSARQLAEEGEGTHFHTALAHLRYSKAELLTSEGAKSGREAAILHEVQDAIVEVETGLKEKGQSSETPDDTQLPVKPSESKHPLLHHALDRLTEARVELQHSEEFNGHRDKAMIDTDNAIRIIEDALHELEK